MSAAPQPLHLVSRTQLDAFDEVIDVRSPSEFADDHLPGAVNLPVLTDAQRVEVGTLYSEDSFEAKRLGAALIMENIAGHLRSHFLTKPRGWHPLVYCWRGGQRSGSLAHILREIGWRAEVIRGGYKAFRSLVRTQLEELCGQTQFHMLTGLTGVGKTELLQVLRSRGHQVLDLEGLGGHRGSLLGQEPDRPQPAQKAFETALWNELACCDPARPVYLESESKRLGRLHLPEPLWQGMKRATVTEITAPLDSRLDFLVREYDHFLRQPERLHSLLPVLVEMHSRAVVNAWLAQIDHGDFAPFVRDILLRHYDPRYRECAREFPASRTIDAGDLSAAALETAARAVTAEEGQPRMNAN